MIVFSYLVILFNVVFEIFNIVEYYFIFFYIGYYLNICKSSVIGGLLDIFNKMDI